MLVKSLGQARVSAKHLGDCNKDSVALLPAPRVLIDHVNWPIRAIIACHRRLELKTWRRHSREIYFTSHFRLFATPFGCCNCVAVETCKETKNHQTKNRNSTLLVQMEFPDLLQKCCVLRALTPSHKIHCRHNSAIQIWVSLGLVLKRSNKIRKIETYRKTIYLEKLTILVWGVVG